MRAAWIVLAAALVAAPLVPPAAGGPPPLDCADVYPWSELCRGNVGAVVCFVLHRPPGCLEVTLA